MEEIKLDSSPAQLLAADADDEGDDAPVSIHEPADDADEGDEPEQAAPTTEQLTPEKRETRRQLIRKFSRYFKAELADITTTGLDTMTLASLQELATDVEFLVGARRSAKAVSGLFLGGLQGLEVAGPMVGFKLAGLANVASQSEDLLTTVDEVAVKYESQLYVDPVARLCLGILQLQLP